jgi:hypothetical protein
MSYPSPYLKVKFKTNYATGCSELIKEKVMTTEEKAKKYDELMLTIQEMEIMYTNMLDKYPNLTEIIQEKLNVLKLVKL